MKENSKERIRKMMEIYGLTQTELCKQTGIQKSALSNYLSGTREPRQDQLSLLADPFGINPAWLMGYEVPMMMSETKKDLTTDEYNLIIAMRECPPETIDVIRRIVAYKKMTRKGDEQ